MEQPGHRQAQRREREQERQAEASHAVRRYVATLDGHGQPHPDLHPHRRRRRDPPRRHEPHDEDRPAPGGVRRRRRGQRPPRARARAGRAGRRRRHGADPGPERPLRRRRRLLHPGRARSRSTRRCGSSRTTSTGSRPGATSTTRTCQPCAPSSSTAAPRARPCCTSRGPSYAGPSGPPGRRTRSTPTTMNALAITYLNRLSDLLFILARHANREQRRRALGARRRARLAVRVARDRSGATVGVPALHLCDRGGIRRRACGPYRQATSIGGEPPR